VTLPQVALLASPLLGPAMWSRTADALVDHGWHVLVVPRLAEAPRIPTMVLEQTREYPATEHAAAASGDSTLQDRQLSRRLG
jgi:hypothetical protein